VEVHRADEDDLLVDDRRLRVQAAERRAEHAEPLGVLGAGRAQLVEVDAGIEHARAIARVAGVDERLVHTGYSRYRARMLDAGVDLYELSPTRTQHTKRLGVFGSSLGRLHAKTAVIDKKIIFIGSMNLD